MITKYFYILELNLNIISFLCNPVCSILSKSPSWEEIQEFH